MKTPPSQPIERHDPTAGEIVKAFVRSVALSLEIFLHGPMGVRYIDCGVAGILVLFLFRNLFYPSEGAPLFWFTVLYTVVWFCRMCKSIYLRHRNRIRCHSMYCGRPHLWRLLPGWREEYVKHLEAFIVIGLGFAVHLLNHPLGDWLIMSATWMLIRSVTLAFNLHCRVLDMHDSALEQRYIAGHFQQLQSDDLNS
jgi:hypothetical protein